MSVNPKDVEAIVKAVIENLDRKSESSGLRGRVAAGVYSSLDDAVSDAFKAQKFLKTVSNRNLAISAMRKAGVKYARELAEMGVAETGMGRVADKEAKNIAQALYTPGTECIEAKVITGDRGLTLIENAAWGVIASVTPSTNTAATIINNAISMVAAGNAVVFAPHPSAKRVSQQAIIYLNEAIKAVGGPDSLLTTVAEPTIEAAQQLFKYPGINLLVVTGGDAVVHAARKVTDKRLIAAGAGNPPAVVDATADLARAAKNIVYGASFDNNIICADEKEIIVVDSVTDQFKRELAKNRAVEITPQQAEQLKDVLFSEIKAGGHGVVSRDWVGRDAAKIAKSIGLDVPEETRLLVVETDKDHPFAVSELMMPVLPIIRASDVSKAIDIAVELEAGCKHTATMHSRDLDALDEMANRINSSIFVKNGPAIAGLGFGGEGWTTMTISTPTGEGATNAASFVRLRRCVMVDHFRIV